MVTAGHSPSKTIAKRVEIARKTHVLERGARNVEILKQNEGSPLPRWPNQ